MTNHPRGRLPDEARPRADDASVATALADLASVLDLPALPDIAGAVRLRLESEQTLRPRMRVPWPSRWPRRAVLVVTLLLVILLVAAGVASAIGFGLPGLQMIFSGATPAPVTSPATQPATATPTASSSPVPLDLGTPTTLTAARSSVTFKVLVPDPARLSGMSAAIFRDDRVLGGAIVLAYPADSSIVLLMTESRGSVDKALLGKVLEADATVEPVRVNGQAGLWISGHAHSLLILDSSGRPVEVTLRQVGDVLVWVQDGTLLRIESPLGLAATLAIAQSMR